MSPEVVILLSLISFLSLVMLGGGGYYLYEKKQAGEKLLEPAQDTKEAKEGLETGPLTADALKEAIKTSGMSKEAVQGELFSYTMNLGAAIPSNAENDLAVIENMDASTCAMACKLNPGCIGFNVNATTGPLGPCTLKKKASGCEKSVLQQIGNGGEIAWSTFTRPGVPALSCAVRSLTTAAYDAEQKLAMKNDLLRRRPNN